MKMTPSKALRALLVVFIFGVAVYSFYPGFQPRPDSVAFHLSKNASVTGIIMKRAVGEKGEQLTLEHLIVDGAPVADKVLAFVPLYSHGELGDKIGVHCDLESPEPFDGFRYDRFLAAKGIFAQCYSRSEPFVLARGVKMGPRIVLGKIHERVVTEIRKTYGEPHAQLLAGLLIGDNAFPDNWKQRFVRTGTSHVVAASGYNVALVSSLALAFLIYAGLKRQYAFPFVLCAIAGFVILAGGEGAVMRAGIMGAIAITASQLGRKSSGWNALLLTVAIMLFFSPRILRDDAGFQLSVLSTAGLMAFAKPLAERLKWIPETFGLRESFSCTLAATLATLPVIIFGFHRLSIIGPFTNLLVLPFLPYAMSAGTTGVITHVLSPIYGGVGGGLLSLPGWFFLECILRVIDAMASLPFAVLNL
ncbi:MAG: ComEC/Rec2 family competence protein [Patescibacteria group bacterium]|jgi:competence protein ComEC